MIREHIRSINAPFILDPLTRRCLTIAIFLIGFTSFRNLPLSRSLWLDETVTAWVISDTWGEAWTRAATFQAQSPLYFLLVKAWPWTDDFGLMTLSLLFGLLSGLGVYLTVRELLGNDAALWSILLLITGTDLLKISIQVRPYALGLVGASWSLIFLLRWLASRKCHLLIFHISSLLLAFYAHYLFGLVGIGSLAAMVLWGDRSAWRPYLIGVAGGSLFAAPGFYHLFWWSRKAGDSLFTPAPQLSEFFKLILPLEAVVFLSFSLVVAAIFAKKAPVIDCYRTLILSLILIFVGLCVLFLASSIAGGSLFIDRYLSWRISGVVLFGVLVVTLIQDQVGQRVFLSVYCLLALQQSVMRRWFIEDWKRVSTFIQETRDIPVFLYSGLRESEQLSGNAPEELRHFLSAPLLHYGVSQERIVVLPGFTKSESASQYSKGVADASRGKNASFFLVVNDQRLFLAGRGSILPKSALLDFFKEEGARCELGDLFGDDARELVKGYRCDWEGEKLLSATRRINARSGD